MKIGINRTQYYQLKDTATYTGISVEQLVANILREWLQTMEDMEAYGRMLEEAEGWVEGY